MRGESSTNYTGNITTRLNKERRSKKMYERRGYDKTHYYLQVVQEKYRNIPKKMDIRHKNESRQTLQKIGWNGGD